MLSQRVGPNNQRQTRDFPGRGPQQRTLIRGACHGIRRRLTLLPAASVANTTHGAKASSKTLCPNLVMAALPSPHVSARKGSRVSGGTLCRMGPKSQAACAYIVHRSS